MVWKLALAAFLALIPWTAFCQEAASGSSDEETGIGWEPKEKILAGSQKYFDSETTLNANLPDKFNLNAGYQYFDSDISSATPVYSLGAGKTWEQGFLTFLYAGQPKVDDYSMNSVDLTGALNTLSKDFKTSLGLDFNITGHDETIETKRTSVALPIREVTPTIIFSQRCYGLKLTGEYGHSTYDRDLTLISERIRPTSVRLEGLSGLLEGFPDIMWKVGLSYDFDALPATLWTDYTYLRMIVTAQTAFAYGNEFELGFDYDLLEWLTAGLEYEYLYQTGQPTANYFGGTVTLHL
jgi:hypothetical protein